MLDGFVAVTSYGSGVLRLTDDEWYVFAEPRRLGPLFEGPFFEFDPASGQTPVLVNMFAFGLHQAEPAAILDLFWNQLPSIEPEAFIADGNDCLSVVSRTEALIDRFARRLAASP